jgi:hypothetical protein
MKIAINPVTLLRMKAAILVDMAPSLGVSAGGQPSRLSCGGRWS